MKTTLAKAQKGEPLELDEMELDEMELDEMELDEMELDEMELDEMWSFRVPPQEQALGVAGPVPQDPSDRRLCYRR